MSKHEVDPNKAPLFLGDCHLTCTRMYADDFAKDFKRAFLYNDVTGEIISPEETRRVIQALEAYLEEAVEDWRSANPDA